VADDDIHRLNERFGRGSMLRFESGPGALTVARIATPDADASIALHGGHVLSFQPRGEKPVLWVSGQSQYAGDKPIRGGIPLCWPWFGPHPTDPGKPAHGFARTSAWTVLGSEAAQLHLGLTDSERTRALWPHPFELELIVSVGLALDVELVVRNPGTAAFRCTGALHSYFAVSDIARATIGGLEGAAYLDKVANYERFQQTGAITIARETDRIYLDTSTECAIADAGWQRTIRVAKRGSRTTVVWNPWAARARELADFGDEEYHGMVCVETANAASDEITLSPGREHRLAARIGVERA
jgi:D-hexose-6-phosphate mutarotase